MGMSADAEIAYGYLLGEFEDEDYNSTAPAWMETFDGDFEEAIATKLGWKKYEGQVNFNEYSSESYRAWDKNLDCKRQVIQGVGLDIIEFKRYGHVEDDVNRYVLTVKPSQRRADMWDALVITPEMLTVEPVWVEKLKLAANLLDLDVDGEPSWLLTVDYG